ncbi:hypothetical protein AB0I55_02645 [Actinocatenispora sera]|uniref:hypothetical protein n=1 Tax=Actinocatenispora sera TaxID=390989 RepID=UPI0033CEE8A0
MPDAVGVLLPTGFSRRGTPRSGGPLCLPVHPETPGVSLRDSRSTGGLAAYPGARRAAIADHQLRQWIRTTAVNRPPRIAGAPGIAGPNRSARRPDRRNFLGRTRSHLREHR